MSRESSHATNKPISTPRIVHSLPSSALSATKRLYEGSSLVKKGVNSLISFNSLLIQPKLVVGSPNDKYEQEADRVAEQVMRMPEVGSLNQKHAAPKIQRACAQCDAKLLNHSKSDEDELIQGKAQTAQISGINSHMASQITNIKHGGHVLPDSTRNYFEPRFNQDFSQVRIHSDGQAAQLASGINAKAFTLGHNIVFNTGQYQPFNHSGRRLLAHELTHVVQQTRSRPATDGYCIQRMTDASFESSGLGTAISSGTMVADNAIMGHTFTARNCRGLYGCNINFAFGKAYKGVYAYAAAGRDVRGVYVKISSTFNSPVCGRCNTVRLIQTLRNITKGSGGNIETADPGNATRRARSGWGDTNAPSRGWRIDRLTSATNPYYTSGASGDTGTSTTPANLWDAPGDWSTDSNAGKEFQTCAVCDHGGTRKVMACVNWGYYTDSARRINFRPATPSASCGPSRELEDAASRWDAISGNQPTNIDFSSEQRIHSGTRSMLFFEQNSTDFLQGDILIDSNARRSEAIRRVRQDMAALGNSAHFVIHGYASEEGAAAHNLDLSRRRAEAVKEIMIRAGIPDDRFSIEPHGEDTTYPGLTYNRRVEIEHTFHMGP